MFRQVLVGIDSESYGADAIALARRLAPSAHFTFVHVCTGFPVIDASETDQERELKHAEDLLDRAVAASGLDADRICASAHRFGGGLHLLAARLDADLIVIGSTRTARIGRVVVTADLAQALNGVPCAVAVAPLGHCDDHVPLGEIGVAYDRSSESRHALVEAVQLASETGSRVVAFTAAPLPHGDLRHGVWDTFASAIRDRVEGACANTRNDIDALGLGEAHGTIPVLAQSSCGDTVEELAQFSSCVDLIVVGSRAYGPEGCLVYGKTSGQLMRNARAPLLLMPRGTEASAGAAVLAEAAQASDKWSGTGAVSGWSIASAAGGLAS